MSDEKRSISYRLGVMVMVVLGVLTIGEYAIGAVATTWWQPLVLIAILKAVMIIRDYMHLPRLFTAGEEGDHE